MHPARKSRDKLESTQRSAIERGSIRARSRNNSHSKQFTGTPEEKERKASPSRFSGYPQSQRGFTDRGGSIKAMDLLELAQQSSKQMTSGG